MIDVTLLGTGGSIPLPDRYLSSAIIEYKGRKILMDAGEGTGVSMRAVRSGFKSLDVICITHLHGDHVIGLQGILGTTSNTGRTEPITIIGPKGIKDVMKGFRVIMPWLNYDINIIEDPTPGEPIVINNKYIHGELSISALPVKHTRPNFAYRVDLKREPKFDPQKAKANEVPQRIWGDLQRGQKPVEYEGKTYTPDMVLGEARKGMRVSWVTDTRPTPEIPGFIEGSDLLLSCANFGSNDETEKAKNKMHMTFAEAATQAKKGHVKEMVLTHFSQAMRDPEKYVKNATDIFPNTVIGKDHMHFTLNYDQDFAEPTMIEEKADTKEND